ncbi:hypothetical protein [Paenibacillus massiliensis]|uniref:hypothetical protein n=1 Tax=Paenibacillus massiliensis TaxID=225917 RepID=UPI0012EBF3DA|nr:hypothetical protein [Paenibacillus massiliensis]
MYKETSPLKWLVALPFTKSDVSFFVVLKDGGLVSRLNSGEDGRIVEKRQRSPLSPDFHRLGE